MAAKAKVVEAVEKAVDIAEETLETVERIPKADLNGTTKKQQYIIIGVTAVVSAVSGGGLVYLVLNKKLKTKYEQIAEEEIREAQRHFKLLTKQEEYKDPVTALETLTEKAKDLGYSVTSPVSTDEQLSAKVEEVAEGLEETADEIREIDAEQRVESITRNIFTEHGSAAYPNFDYNAEMSKRSEAYPYLLREDEFMHNEHDWDQQSLTYYEKDGVLVDERDNPIDESDTVVGDGNLMRFGHGTKDPNTVYIRNERLELEFEISRSKRSYSEDVLGFTPELKHSEKRGGVLRYRNDDG